jgi:hypothetical protein
VSAGQRKSRTMVNADRAATNNQGNNTTRPTPDLVMLQACF